MKGLFCLKKDKLIYQFMLHVLSFSELNATKGDHLIYFEGLQNLY